MWEEHLCQGREDNLSAESKSRTNPSQCDVEAALPRGHVPVVSTGSHRQALSCRPSRSGARREPSLTSRCSRRSTQPEAATRSERRHGTGVSEDGVWVCGDVQHEPRSRRPRGHQDRAEWCHRSNPATQDETASGVRRCIRRPLGVCQYFGKQVPLRDSECDIGT